MFLNFGLMYLNSYHFSIKNASLCACAYIILCTHIRVGILITACAHSGVKPLTPPHSSVLQITLLSVNVIVAKDTVVNKADMVFVRSSA